jgi:hypothetical protein
MTKLQKIIADLIDIPRHKLGYAISYKELAYGMKATILRYGIPYTKEVHDELVEMVGAKLSGNEDIEYDWTEAQYENFVKFEEITGTVP